MLFILLIHMTLFNFQSLELITLLGHFVNRYLNFLNAIDTKNLRIFVNNSLLKLDFGQNEMIL